MPTADESRLLSVLYIGGDLKEIGADQGPLREALDARGVEFTLLRPVDIQIAKQGGGEPLRDLAEQLRSATLVLVGKRAEEGHALGAVMLRREQADGTWIDGAHLNQVCGLDYFTESGAFPFRIVGTGGMLAALHAMYAQVTPAPATLGVTDALRPAQPTPFRDSAWGQTEIASSLSAIPRLAYEARSGILDPIEATWEMERCVRAQAPQRMGRSASEALSGHLRWLSRHLPSDRMWVWSEPRMAIIWQAITDFHDPLSSAIWTALIRDHGTQTLALLPKEFHEVKDRLQREWTETLPVAQEAIPERAFSFEVNKPWVEDRVGEILGSSVIPLEDPFEDGAVGPSYMPTIHTLLAARRYRSAPEVVRLAHELFGSRIFTRLEVGYNLVHFVTMSPPTSAAEVEEWCRLVNALEGKRKISRHVAAGMQRWDVLPPALYEPVVRGSEPNGRWWEALEASKRLPWLGWDGTPMPEFVTPDTQQALEHFRARMDQRGREAQHAVQNNAQGRGR